MASRVSSWETEKDHFGKEIIQALYQQRMIRTWYRDKPEGWVLISGLWSPFYVQLRPLSSVRNAGVFLKTIGKAMTDLLRNEAPKVNKLVGVATAGIPIAVTTTIHSGIPSCYTRKLERGTVADLQAKIASYGEHSLVEGELEDGDVVAIVDDLVTRFDSKLVALEQIRHEIRTRERELGRPLNITINDIVVLFDREQGATERAKTVGLKLHSIIPFKSKGVEWLRDKISPIEYDVLSDYLRDEAKYQAQDVQAKLREEARKNEPRT